MGRIDVETTGPFRRTCLTQLQGKRVVFDMSALNFVGSSGLIPFFETLNDFAKRNDKGLRFSGMSLEFKRLIQATPLGQFPIFESIHEAVHRYDQPPVAVEVAAVSPAAAEAAPLEGQAAAEFEAPGEPEAAQSVDLFSMVRASFEEKMGRPLDPVSDLSSSKPR
jgi:anti-anti-sigma regulatory factor